MCEEALKGDGHPMPNSLQFVFPMIVAPEAFQQVDEGRVERRLGVFNDESKAKGRSAFAHRDSG